MNLQTTYLREISAYPQLSPQEETSLALRARQGDTEARDQLIQSNLLLVVNIARQYLRPGIDIMDLIQEGNIGLMEAVDKFNPEQGNRLSTLAFYWINKQIQRFLDRAQDDTLSLDMEITDSSEYLLLSDTIEDRPTLLGDQSIKHIDAEMEHKELQRQLAVQLDKLSLNEQKVLQLFYGLEGYPCMTREEIAKTLCIKADQVSRIKTRALERLRRLFSGRSASI